MRRAGQIAKWGLIGTAGLLAAVALVLAGGLAWLRSDGGREWLARQIEDAASTPGSLQVTLGGLGGALPQSLTAHDIVVSDAEGPFLTIASLQVEWEPWQLLRRTLAVRQVALGAVDLAHLPAGAESDTAEDAATTPRDLLDFPLKVRLDRLAVEEIALGAPVLGQPARFSLTGQADRHDDGGLSARLDLRRADRAGEHLVAAVQYAPPDDRLTADIEAVAAPGGIVAALLDMPDLPQTTLSLEGSGPLADWPGRFALSVGELAEVTADVRLARSQSGDLAFQIDGRSDLRPTNDFDLAPLVAGESTIGLHGAWQDGRRLHLDRFAVANRTLRIDLQGDIVPQDETLHVTLSAAAEDATALARMADLDGLRRLAADIAINGSFGMPQVTLDLRAEQVASPDLTVEAVSLSGSAAAVRDLLGPSPLLALDLDGRVDRPRLPGQDAVNGVIGDTLPLRLVAQLDLATLMLEVSRLETATNGMTIVAGGPFSLDDGSASFDTAISADDLAVLQPLTEIRLGGAARLSGPVTLEGFGRRIAADLAGRWEQPSSDIDLLTAAAGDGLDVTARLAIEGPVVRIEEATARSPATDLSAALVVADGALSGGRYSLRLTDAGVLAGALGVAAAGPATVEGDIAGPFDALTLDGRATLARLSVEEQALHDVVARYRLTIEGGDVTGPVDVALASPFGPARGATSLAVRGDAVTLSGIDASLPQTRVSGSVTVPLDGNEPSAELHGEVASLAPWLEFAGFAGNGRGRIALTLNRPGAPAPLSVTAELSGVRFLPAPSAEPIIAERLTMSLQGRDMALAEPAALDLEASALRQGDIVLDRADVKARGTFDALDVTLDTEGRWSQPLALSAAARVTREAQRTTVVLDRAEGQAFGRPLALGRPATLSLAPGATRIEDLAIASGDARLTADVALDSDRIAAQASLESLPLAALDPFWDSGLAGELNAEVEISGGLDDPRGQARLAARDLRPRDSRDAPPLQLTATADWRGGRLAAQGELGGAEVAAARFAADAPLRLSADGAPVLPSDEPISGNLDWSGDIRTLLLFVPLPEHRLEGRAEVAVTVGGTLQAPTADGRIALASGLYENLEMGTLLRDLAVTAEVSKERVSLVRLEAVDGAGGRVTGSGTLALDPRRDFPVDVAVRLDKFHAVRRDDVTAVTGGEVSLTGSLAKPLLTGRFATETVEVSLLTDLPPDVVSLDVIEMKDGEAQPRPPENSEEAAIDAVLDVVVEMPRRVFVRGRGLDSEWAGRLSVKGPAAAPSVAGKLTLVRGQMSVVGKPFRLQEGEVTLPEGADTEPALDVTAVHQGQDLTVTARLSGPLSQPELDLSSVPQVPRDEIVSRVLFNKSAAQLSAAEAAQLAIALRELTGAGGGTDILGFARHTLGVDVLRIETAEGDTPALEAGKYLTDDVYVGVKQGTTAQSSSAGVEIELTPNVTLESEVTGQGANKSGVRFQWDY
ncbi:MAG: translocation/assembly module TamB domain-containing protein [Bacteroidota bacterium]|nr:translocation/assembly module TamB domain-containing protein [Kiloniellaceae bacterium]